MQRLWGIVASAVAAGEFITKDGLGPEVSEESPKDIDVGVANMGGLDANDVALLRQDFLLFDECVAVLRHFSEGGLMGLEQAVRKEGSGPVSSSEDTVETSSSDAGAESTSSDSEGLDQRDVESVSIEASKLSVAVGGADGEGIQDDDTVTAFVRDRSAPRIVVVSTIADSAAALPLEAKHNGAEVGDCADRGGIGSELNRVATESLGTEDCSEAPKSPTQDPPALSDVRGEPVSGVSDDHALGASDRALSGLSAEELEEDVKRMGECESGVPGPNVSAVAAAGHHILSSRDNDVAPGNAVHPMSRDIMSPPDRVVHALGTLAELMVRSDQTNAALWERFLESSCMRLLVACLGQTKFGSSGDAGESAASAGQHEYPKGPASSDAVMSISEVANILVEKRIAVRIQASVLRAISILVHSVRRRESLYCLFVSDHVNNLLSFDFDFADEEVLLYFVSAVKSIGLSLDQTMVELFFDARAGSFPLYSCTTRFHAHPDGMVRIAVRNLTLTVYALGSPSVTDYVLSDPGGYLTAAVDRLARLCGEIAGAFEFLLDDGREVRRSVSRRVGRFRQKVRMPHLQAELAEVDNMLEYLNDVLAVDDPLLRNHLLQLLVFRFFRPFFRPISSQASPEALTAASNRWGFRAKSEGDSNTSLPALSSFDAAARAIVLAYVVNLAGKQPLGVALWSEVVKPTARFEGRSALHGIRAMASDLAGRERTTHIAVCVLEAIARWEAFPREKMARMGFSFDLQDGDAEPSPASVVRMGSGGSDLQSPGSSGPSEPRMVMSLLDFRAPLTPTGSLNKTESMSSDTSVAPESPRSPASPLLKEETDDEGILFLFRRGEASLREIVSAILLVVRTREVRTVRVSQAVVRLISAVGLRTDDWRLSLDIAKISLDEMASTMTDFLANSATTIVAIEAAFENFAKAASAESPACSGPPDLCALLHIDSLHKFAAELPDGAGLRRRSAALGNAAVPPVEMADATSFFVLLKAYERILSEVLVAEGERLRGPSSLKARSLSEGVAAILQDGDASLTYLDKKEALARVAHLTLKYNIFSRSF